MNMLCYSIQGSLFINNSQHLCLIIAVQTNVVCYLRYLLFCHLSNTFISCFVCTVFIFIFFN